ncbi:MOSC domain-containing protein [Actinomadura kijaniata]|uniref:MOSC domain-containing protein n=1 Tax=Actinomadura kijaniata TaxID=46161 RepID=UPI003F1DE9AB
MATIVELITYPVKGCAGVPRAAATLTPAGLEHDRAFMVTGPDGTFRSQRRDPRLALVRPDVSADGAVLTLRAPGLDDLRLQVDLDAGRRDVTMFGAPYQGIDQGEAAAAWLTEALGAPSRLVRFPPEHDRVTDGLVPGRAAYADSGAVHAVSRATLRALNDRVPGPPVPLSRFRPNLVIDGWDDPHREDRVRRLAAGDAELAYAKPAIRCAVTLVDQDTAAKAGPEPLRTLATYRRAPGGGVAFGVKLSVTRPGTLATGAAIDVLAWGDPEV